MILHDAILAPKDVNRFSADPRKMFRTNLASVEDRIACACEKVGQTRSSVRLLPITKTVPANILRFAHAAGIHSFGENNIQEAMTKRQSLDDLSAE